MHIDAFINKYTPIEVERIERKDVVSKFQNKMAEFNMNAQCNKSMTFADNSPIRLSCTGKDLNSTVLQRSPIRY